MAGGSYYKLIKGMGRDWVVPIVTANFQKKPLLHEGMLRDYLYITKVI